MKVQSLAALEVRNLAKTFFLPDGKSIEALVDINFRIEPGEICAILGPSGCGKSTILRIIAGLETPSSGLIEAGGIAVDGPGRDRGMVFQEYTSFDWMTVSENVEYGMKVNGVPAKERRDKALEFVRLVKLDRFANAFPSQLSGGMKQRVAIARTLANDPRFLLMDEPFGALDAETRWHMQELLAEIVSQTRTTVIIVTHDIEEAIFLADRIVMLSANPGRLHEIILPDLRSRGKVQQKEEFLQLPGVATLETRIMRLMRQSNDLAY